MRDGDLPVTHDTDPRPSPKYKIVRSTSMVSTGSTDNARLPFAVQDRMP